MNLVRINAEKRRIRMEAARQKGTHTKDEWEEMKEHFKVCVRCETPGNLVKDHIIPIYQGGSDSIRNIQPLCHRCNSSKGPENDDLRPRFCNRNLITFPDKWAAHE